jgi:hypothetical protein
MYSIVKHLARAIYFGAYRTAHIAVFTAYFDASGDKRQKVLTFAGFVSRIQKWDRFDREWSDMLARYGVPSLHMSEFVSSSGAFSAWRGQSEKRKLFIDEAVSCVKHNTNKGFACSIILSEHNEINAKYRLAEYAGKPYSLCGVMAIAMVREWAKKKRTDPKKILYMIEDGDEDRGQLIERSKRDGYKVFPLAKLEAQAFQAADMVAWKAMSALREAENKGRLTLDEYNSIARSLEPISPVVHSNSVVSGDKLQLLCNDNGIPVR